MMISLFVWVCTSLLGAEAFFYRALPLVYKDGHVNCPPNAPAGATCVYDGGWFGFKCNNDTANVLGFINPLAENCKNTPVNLCTDHELAKKKRLLKCVEYTTCHPLSDARRVCTCDREFFGNPYKKCLRVCNTDNDCPSPYAHCFQDPKTPAKYCKCRYGTGDGVFCVSPSKCQLQKNSEGELLCVQTGANTESFVCPEGKFLDEKDGKCHSSLSLKENKTLTLVAENFVDGQQITIGDCISMIINAQSTTSTFSHVNSGDPIVYKGRLLTNPQLFLAFEIKENDIVVYGVLESDTGRLTRLYSVTNTAVGCNFDKVHKLNSLGKPLDKSDITTTLRDITYELDSKPEPEKVEL